MSQSSEKRVYSSCNNDSPLFSFVVPTKMITIDMRANGADHFGKTKITRLVRRLINSYVSSHDESACDSGRIFVVHFKL